MDPEKKTQTVANQYNDPLKKVKRRNTILCVYFGLRTYTLLTDSRFLYAALFLKESWNFRSSGRVINVCDICLPWNIVDHFTFADR